MKGECVTCKHYMKDNYCVLMDEIVAKLDNCGMYDGEDR